MVLFLFHPVRYTRRWWNLIKEATLTTITRTVVFTSLTFEMWTTECGVNLHTCYLLASCHVCMSWELLLCFFSLSVTIFILFEVCVWLFTKPLPFFPGLLSGAGSHCWQLVDSPVLLTLGRFGAKSCPVTEVLGQVEGVKPWCSLWGPWGVERRSEFPAVLPFTSWCRSGIPDFGFCFYHWKPRGLGCVI